MAKILQFVVLMLLAQYAIAIDTLTVSSSIKHATVFLSGAEVNRAGEINLPAGKTFLRFNDLPYEISPNSIQAKAGSGTEILSVKHFLEDNQSFKRSAEMRGIELSQKKIKQQITLNNEKISVYKIEEEVLYDNRNINAEKGVKPTELKLSADFYRARLLEIREAILKLSNENEDLNDSLTELNKQMNQASSKVNKVSSWVLVAVEDKNGGTAKLELNYFIKSAGWEPMYDFRYRNLNVPLTLVYQANVFQSSGENWDNVLLTLSNSQPTMMATNPVIKRWYIDRYEPQSYRMPSNGSFGSGSIKGKLTDKNNGEPVPFANVVVKRNGVVISGAQTDFDGNFFIKPLDAGKYDLEASFAGFGTIMKQGVPVNADEITFQNVQMTTSSNLAEVVIETVKDPLVRRDGSNEQTIGRDGIMKMAGRSGESVAKTLGGVSNAGYGETINMRGSRSDGGNFVYIDGVKVRGSANLPKAALNSVTVITGGLPASYGEVGGGIISNDSYYPPSTRSISSGSSSAQKLLGGAVNMNEINKTPQTVDYEVKVPYTIKSDGIDNTIRIKSIEVEANYVHYAIPKLDPSVFLTAELTKWQNLNLLNGTANIYYQGTFIGATDLDVESTDDTLSLSLGRDPEVVVERTAIKELYEKKTLGNNIKETFAWELAVRNNKGAQINLVLQDQYPLAVQKSVETELLERSDAKLNTDEGILLWKVPVKAGDRRVFKFKYSVKYPEGLAVYK